MTYSAGEGPATVFVKAADPDHEDLIRMTSGLFHEPRLFNSGVDLPLEHPAVHAALIDEAGYDFVLVMEDLTARDATRPLTAEQAASGLRGLGRLHGHYWAERVLRNPALGWLEPFVPWEGMQYAPLPAALERLRKNAPDEVMALTIDQLIESIRKPYIRTLTTAPQTLLHGDPHIGNTYLTPDGKVGFLDWQVTRRGNWPLDVGYFLQGAMTTEDRCQNEHALLEQYREALALPPNEMPTMDEVWLRYRASVAHGVTLWLCTASAGELDTASALADLA